jgi:hypothetical protein
MLPAVIDRVLAFCGAGAIGSLATITSWAAANALSGSGDIGQDAWGVASGILGAATVAAIILGGWACRQAGIGTRSQSLLICVACAVTAVLSTHANNEASEGSFIVSAVLLLAGVGLAVLWATTRSRTSPP